ncbi:DegT/DnrJ/EryC1/StrS family aminotransferase [Rudanella lutea]|uniref:DegT/DnrJ/EryC1/StrS family aminotransferase n=1 Tax=Rudanella lutea TaxID=451374 RepID=UPI0003787DD6|nr:DegT/DnrJ/EryC1/StrS family aminotransferase [Rudanella lutea]
MPDELIHRTIPQIVPYLDEQDAAAVLQTIQNNWITEGPQSALFVDALRQLIGVPYGVLAPNGTMALSLGLMALGIGPGDEVLVPDITFAGSASAVLMVGAMPVFVEVEPDTFQIDMNRAAEGLSARTRAIMPVHLYGTACDMEAVDVFAQQHGLFVIEDAAQGIGVRHRGKHVGSFGDVSCFSFFADKTITTGEGGFVACRDEAIYQRLCLLRNQGRMERGSFVHPAVGFNFRMTDMQAAIGVSQLRKLDDIISWKQLLWSVYEEGLSDITQIRVVGAAPHSTHVPFRCVLIAERANELQSFLAEYGVQTRSFFYPLHRQPCFTPENSRTLPARPGAFTAYAHADYGFERGLCLPLYPTLGIDNVQYMVRKIRSFYRHTTTV